MTTNRSDDRSLPEPHWPGWAAPIAAAALNFLLPASLAASPGWFGVLAVAALAMLTAASTKWHRLLGFVTTGIATAQIALALVKMILDLTSHRGRPADLLQGALIVWSMTILVFASWYWRLDAGGPHRRANQPDYGGGAFVFAQFTLPPELRAAAGANGWRPHFIDYLFLAFNTSTAFSPTDVPVLSSWAKILMMIQSSISLATLAMVAARAVNIL